MKYIQPLGEGNIELYAVRDKVRELIGVVNSQDTSCQCNHQVEIDEDMLKQMIKKALDEILQEENNAKETNKKEKESSKKSKGSTAKKV